MAKAISDFDQISSSEFEETSTLKTTFDKFGEYVSGWEANIKKMISKSKKFEESFRYSGAEFDSFSEILEKRKSVSRILMHETIDLNTIKKQLFKNGYSKEEWKMDERKLEGLDTQEIFKDQQISEFLMLPKVLFKKEI